MIDETDLEKRISRLHHDTLICDYYPLGLPLVLDGEIEEGVHAKIAAGVDGNAIVYDIFDAYLDRMEAGGKPGLIIKERLEKALAVAGVDCITLTLGRSPRPMSDFTGLLEHAAWWRRFADQLGVLRICTNKAEVLQAHSEGRIALLFALQEGGCIESDLSRLDLLYGEGVRIFQVTYNKNNALGSGCADPAGKGLTELGGQAIRRMNELGMVVDLSHCNHRTTMEGLRASARPAAITHSSCTSVWSHGRAKNDEVLELLAEKDGFFGVYTVPAFLSDNPHPGFELFIRHLRHAIGVMGIGRVGIGTDWGLWSPDVPTELAAAMVEAAYRAGFSRDMKLISGTALEGMSDYTDWIRITGALAEAGFSDEQLAGLLGGNFLRFLDRAVGA